MTYFIMGLAILTIIIALSYFTNIQKQKKVKKIKKNSSSNPGVSLVNCPMCNTPLLKGQNLISKVYRPMDVPDQRCTINGCPHCYPQPEIGIRRQCPCCKKEVPITGYLVARLFNYRDNKKHVMVTGCSECYKK